jgi:hypothetical protein
MDVKQNLKFPVPGLPNPMSEDMTIGQELGLTVLKSMPQGEHEVEMEFLSAHMGFTMGDKTLLDYDSTKKSSGQTNSAAAVFGKLIGSKIIYFMGVSNEVERMEGVDELVNRIKVSEADTVGASLKGMFNASYLKELMNAYHYLPSKPAQPGDRWQVHSEFPVGPMGGMIMVRDYKFSFRSWEMRGKRNCVRMEFQGSITSKLDSTPTPSDVPVSSLNGDSSGVLWFDPELGMFIENVIHNEMKIVGNTPSKPGGNVIEVTQVITFKLE